MIHNHAASRIVFVCLGNICRSPTAEGIMRKLVHDAGRTDVTVESAGTGRWHVGEPPDRRTQAAARRRGVILDQVGRQFIRADFPRFDLILAADLAVARALRDLAPDADARGRIRLLRSFDPAAPPDAEVPDPYYGEAADFDRVFDVCEAACRGLLASLPPPAVA